MLFAKKRLDTRGPHISGCKPHPANAPAGSNRSSHGGNKWLKPSISVSRIGDSASVQAVTRVNAEQASKRAMRIAELQAEAVLIDSIAASDSVLMMWVTNQHLDQGIDLMRAAGFISAITGCEQSQQGSPVSRSPGPAW